MEMPPGFLEGLQESVARLRAQQLRAGDDGDAPPGLIRSSRSEGEGLANPVDADLDPLGRDPEEIGMEARERAPAGLAGSPGVLPRTEQSGGQSLGLFREALVGIAGEQERPREVSGARRQPFEQRRGRQSPNLSATTSQVRSKICSGESPAGRTATRRGSRRAISR